MSISDDELRAAFSDYQRLLTAHTKFADDIARTTSYTELSISALGDKIHVVYLDKKFDATRRSVAVENELKGNKYDFREVDAPDAAPVCSVLVRADLWLMKGNTFDDKDAALHLNSGNPADHIIRQVQRAAWEAGLFNI